MAEVDEHNGGLRNSQESLGLEVSAAEIAQLARTFIDSAPGSLSALLQGGRAQLLAGHFGAARAAYDEAARICPSAAAVPVCRAELHMRSRQIRSCAEQVHKALELSPDHPLLQMFARSLELRVGRESAGRAADPDITPVVRVDPRPSERTLPPPSGREHRASRRPPPLPTRRFARSQLPVDLESELAARSSDPDLTAFATPAARRRAQRDSRSPRSQSPPSGEGAASFVAHTANEGPTSFPAPRLSRENMSAAQSCEPLPHSQGSVPQRRSRSRRTLSAFGYALLVGAALTLALATVNEHRTLTEMVQDVERARQTGARTTQSELDDLEATLSWPLHSSAEKAAVRSRLAAAAIRQLLEEEIRLPRALEQKLLRHAADSSPAVRDAAQGALQVARGESPSREILERWLTRRDLHDYERDALLSVAARAGSSLALERLNELADAHPTQATAALIATEMEAATPRRNRALERARELSAASSNNAARFWESLLAVQGPNERALPTANSDAERLLAMLLRVRARRQAGEVALASETLSTGLRPIHRSDQLLLALGEVTFWAPELRSTVLRRMVDAVPVGQRLALAERLLERYDGPAALILLEDVPEDSRWAELSCRAAVQAGVTASPAARRTLLGDVARDPFSSREALVAAIDVELETHGLEQAHDLYRRLAQLGSSATETSRVRVSLAMAEGHLDHAREVAASLQGVSAPEVLRTMGQLARRLGALDTARRYLVRAEELAPAFAAASFELAELSLSARQLDAAIERFDSLLRSGGGHRQLVQRATLGKVRALTLAGRALEANRVLKATSLPRDDAFERITLEVALASGRTDEVLKELALRARARLTPEWWQLYARALEAAKQSKSAEQVWCQQLAPVSDEVQVTECARLRLLHGDSSGALQVLATPHRTLTADEESRRLTLLARSLVDAPERAIGAATVLLRRATLLAPQDADAHFWLGVTLNHQHLPGQRQAFRKALELDPRGPRADRARRMLLLLGDIDFPGVNDTGRP